MHDDSHADISNLWFEPIIRIFRMIDHQVHQLLFAPRSVTVDRIVHSAAASADCLENLGLPPSLNETQSCWNYSGRSSSVTTSYGEITRIVLVQKKNFNHMRYKIKSLCPRNALIKTKNLLILFQAALYNVDPNYGPQVNELW